ncbi:SET and MYND domain-containing protein 4 [Lepeophtheirus salmonis]|uniref:Protein-lysine N-methyltransferase SMYD4 n=1 Tax=Lepeophtheirus salmonis TaxID=72036 RepID=A0A0K2SV98_LEPSM|nr:SET and MYND domain-containing protein 4-like [Lepeophtheirus salmonis]
MSKETQGGSWQGILDSLTEKALKDGLVLALSRADTFEGKISRVQYSIGIRNKIASWISHCAENRYTKSGAVASKLRDEGNIKFPQKENVGVCLRLYSESVISAGEYGPELGLAYGNRSATLYQLNHYEAALEDIHLAFKHHYPLNLRYKLHQRQGSCLAQLGRFSEAIQAFERGLTSLKDALKLRPEKKDALAKDINALKVEVMNSKDTKIESSTATLPPSEPSNGNNPDFPSASSKLTLQRYNGERRVVAHEKVDLGETLFIESPYAMVLLPGFYSTLCHHCTKAFVAPIPCLKCTQPRFCSEKCRSIAWDVYHQFECTGLDLAHSVGIAHLALRIILNAGFPLIKSLMKDIHKVWKYKGSLNFEEIDFVDNDICNEKKNSYIKVFNLMDHVDDLSPEDLFQYTVTAILLTTYLQKRTKFFKQAPSSLESNMENLGLNESDDPEMFLFIAGLMLKHICQLVCNGSAIYEVLPETVSDCDMDVSNNNPIVYSTSQQRVATAIYSSVSMLNHSCNPNVINSFHEGKIIVRAIRPISSKSEVFNCYGPHFRRHSLSERREMLQFQYHFHCTCEVCSDESKFNFQDRFLALKCHFCAGPVFDSGKEGGGSPSSAPGICGDCGREQENSDHVREVLVAYNLYKNGIDALDRGLVCDALPLLQSCYQMRVEALYANHREVTEVANQLAKAYCTMGSFEESAQYLQVTLPAILERFGEYSLEYAYELLNYADVMICDFQDGSKRISRFLEKIEDTRNCLIKAATVFDLHYGKWNKTYRETMVKFKKLDFFSESYSDS